MAPKTYQRVSRYARCSIASLMSELIAHPGDSSEEQAKVEGILQHLAKRFDEGAGIPYPLFNFNECFLLKLNAQVDDYTIVKQEDTQEEKDLKHEEELPANLEAQIATSTSSNVQHLRNDITRFFLSAFTSSQVLFFPRAIAPETEAATWALRALSTTAGHKKLRSNLDQVILVNRDLAIAVFGQDIGSWMNLGLMAAAPLAANMPPEIVSAAASSVNPSVTLLRHRPEPDFDTPMQDIAGPSS